MKIKVVTIAETNGNDWIEHRGLWEPKDEAICYHCKKSLLTENHIYLCQKGKTLTCDKCEKGRVRLTSSSGEIYWSPENHCPNVPHYNNVIEQTPSQVMGDGYDLEHIHLCVKFKGE